MFLFAPFSTSAAVRVTATNLLEKTPDVPVVASGLAMKPQRERRRAILLARMGQIGQRCVRGALATVAIVVFVMALPSAAQETNPVPVNPGGNPATKAQNVAITPILSSVVGQEYTRPHDLVDVGGGRKMNLFCMGTGAPTVVFDSGLSDWSSIWALVQPGVARITRACSYDRAGMGYSAPSDVPRSPVAIDEDLHALLHGAEIAMPVVLVGHSLGGFNMKLYAALYPEDVAGLVLVDPSEERSFERTAAIITAKYGAAVSARIFLDDITDVSKAIASYNQCAEATATKDLDPASDLYKRCTDPVRTPLGPDIAAARQKIQIGRAYQVAQASELAFSVYGDPRPDPVYARLFSGQPFGNRPLIVLTHSIYDANDPDAAAEFFEWKTLHDQTAGLSRRGVNRIVPGTHHNIEVDQPQAIIDAVAEVVKEVAAQ